MIIMIDILKNLFFPIIKCWYVVIPFIIYLIIKIFYVKIRGSMGEFWVRNELDKLNKNDYIVLNNIMIETGNKTHQIDHVVVSKYGIFVIETKNYHGLISGNESDEYWFQYIGKKKNKFYNPIRQNYGHIKALEESLNIDYSNFISLIVFSNQVKLKIDNNTNVVKTGNIIKTIKMYNEIKLEDINKLANEIKSLNITDSKKREEHVDNIKQSINTICPKCGGTLVKRKSKYGKFLGCSNYPKCQYIKNIY